jgi:hypothetical protein
VSKWRRSLHKYDENPSEAPVPPPKERRILKKQKLEEARRLQAQTSLDPNAAPSVMSDSTGNESSTPSKLGDERHDGNEEVVDEIDDADNDDDDEDPVEVGSAHEDAVDDHRDGGIPTTAVVDGMQA